MSTINAVAYLRRSTDKQDASIPDQRTAVKAYAAAHGYNILREYVDDAISGDATEKRYEFQRMIADADKGDFAAILCWDQDRFGRFDSMEAGYWTYPLRQAGVALTTVSDGPIDWNDFTGRVMYGLKQEGKHQFLRDLSRNVVRGQLEAAKAGSWLGSRPYAYEIEGQRKHKGLIVGDAAKVRIVQRIFREFVGDGRSMSNIADRLNDEHIPSPGERGKPWRFDTVKTILENPAYVGDYAGARYAYGKYHSIHNGQIEKSTGSRRCRRPEAEWIVHQDHHEAIIDRESFAKAKAILAKGKTGRSPHTPEANPYVLTGLLRCGRCGSPMWGMTANKVNKYYRCANQQYNGNEACEGCTVREDAVLKTIGDFLNDEFLSLDGLADKARAKQLKPGDLPKAFDKVKNLIAPKQPACDRRRMERQAKELAAKIDKAKRNLVLLDPEYIPTAQEEIRRLQGEREQLERELRDRPISETDLNAETLAVLNNLNWLCAAFRAAGNAQDDQSFRLRWLANPKNLNKPNSGEPIDLAGDIRQALRSISTITVHTAKVGRANGTRHVLERGEIAFQNSCRGYGKAEPSPPD